jgi:hypothetical protein
LSNSLNLKKNYIRKDRRQISPIERTIKIVIRLTYSLAIIALLFYWWATCNRIDKKYAARCVTERTLQFEGVVSNYQTDIFAEQSTFLLNDSAKISIPRSSKEIPLQDGDTITKLVGQNSYIIRWSHGRKDITGATMRRFDFDCPNSK